MTHPTAYEFKAEIQQLLNILVHSLYTDREIFLRELASNASDALNRLRFEQLTNANIIDPDAELKITVRADKDARTITITDTGIGMNRDEIVQNLGTIAHSGAKSFLAALQARGEQRGTEIIGQFGVGFYSVFMVADKVVVTSRSFRPDDVAVRWTSDGGNSYTVEDAEKAERGTEITLHLKEDAAEFADDSRLERIIRKHSNYVAFPIYIGEKVVNEQTALWRKPAREVAEKDYHDFYSQLTFDYRKPLMYVHQAADAPVQFYSLLYVPSALDRGFGAPDLKESGPRLYARKVLIQEHSKDLLPEWLRFIEGVVDSEDLPLNISRETVQSNRDMQRLKTALTNKLISELDALATKDPEKYATLWREFGRFLKEGAITDSVYREKLLPLLRFRTANQPDGLTSLRDYVAKMVDGQEHIYYLFGDDPKAALQSPHLDVFRSRGVDVLLLTDTMDSFLVNAIAEFEGKKLHNGADADLKLPEKAGGEQQSGESLTTGEADSLVGRFKAVLGDQVADVRTTTLLTESPARLASPDQGFGADMERVYRLLNKDFELPKRILEINPRHPLIRNLATLSDETLASEIMRQIFENALLIEGIHPRPVDMVKRIQAIMEAAARREA